MSQPRRRYVSNETPNDVSVKRRQDVSGVRLHDVLLECCDNLSKWCKYPPAPWRRGDVVTNSFCTSQRHCRYVLNETPNDVSVVLLHDVLLECCDGFSRGCNNDVPSVRLHDVSNKSQMKQPNDVLVVCHQDVSAVRINDVTSIRLYDVSCNSQMKYPATSLLYVSTTSQSYVVTEPCQ